MPEQAGRRPAVTGRRREDERGAVAVTTGALAIVLVVVAAFAVDLGMQRVARRDMQSIADVVALDLARELDGSPGSVLAAPGGPMDTALDAGVRNNAASALGSAPAVTYRLGTIDPADGSFLPLTADAPPTAVEVTADTEVDFAFGVAARGGASRTAVAEAAQAVCWSARTYAAGLVTQAGVLQRLGSVLGANVTAAGYGGLAGSSVSLLAVAQTLGVGTVDALVEMPDLTVAELANATATVLSNQAPQTQANAEALSALNLLAQNSTNVDAGLGEVIHLGLGSSPSVLDADANLFHLLTAGPILMNAAHFADVPVSVSIPGLVVSAARLTIIEPPQLGCSPGGVARTGQVRLDLSISTAALSAGSLLNLTTISAGTVTLRLTSAYGEASLDALQCVDGQPVRADLDVLSALATTSLDLQGLHATLLGVPLGSLVTVNADVSPTQPDPDGPQLLALPTYYAPSFLDTGQSRQPFGDVRAATLNLLGIPLGNATSLATALTTALVVPLNAGLAPVLAGLGITVPGLQLAVLRPASCASPRLVG